MLFHVSCYSKAKVNHLTNSGNQNVIFLFCFKLFSEVDVEKRLPKAKLISLCQTDPVQDYVKHYDHVLYQGLVEVLIPDVLRPIPSKFITRLFFSFL